MRIARLLFAYCIASFASICFGQTLTVSNPVLSISITSTWGGAINSVKVLGTEVVDVADVGREIQPSLYFNTTQTGLFCVFQSPLYYNSVLGGDLCDNRSPIYAIGSDA